MQGAKNAWVRYIGRMPPYIRVQHAPSLLGELVVNPFDVEKLRPGWHRLLDPA